MKPIDWAHGLALTLVWEVGCWGKVACEAQMNWQVLHLTLVVKLDHTRAAVRHNCMMQAIRCAGLSCCRYGRPEATDEEVLEAASLAHLSAAVARMPDGFNTGGCMLVLTWLCCYSISH